MSTQTGEERRGEESIVMRDRASAGAKTIITPYDGTLKRRNAGADFPLLTPQAKSD